MNNKNILIIDYVLFANDVSIELEKRGYNIIKVESSDLTISKFQNLCKNHSPKFVFTINYSPEIALLASSQNIKYISWTIDPLSKNRFRVIPNTKTDLCYLYVHDNTMVTQFIDIGLRNTQFLPLATSCEVRKPINDEKILSPYKCFISFVGQSLSNEKRMSIKELREIGMDRPLQKRIEHFLNDLYVEKANSYDYLGIIRNVKDIPNWIYDNLDADITHIAMLLDSLLSYILRLEKVKIVDEFNINTYGDKSWFGKVGNYKGIASHESELTTIYNASFLNLDLPRVYQRNIITMRVFDIMATNNIVLSEPTESMTTLFQEGIHFIGYKNTNDLVQKVSEIKKNKQKYSHIANSARNEILNKHTIKHRIDVILQTLEN